MVDMVVLTEFWGWCLVLNLAFLMFTTAMLFLCKSRVADIHSKISGVDKSELNNLYFSCLSNFKIITITFFLVPYLALKIMA